MTASFWNALWREAGYQIVQEEAGDVAPRNLMSDMSAAAGSADEAAPASQVDGGMLAKQAHNPNSNPTGQLGQAAKTRLGQAAKTRQRRQARKASTQPKLEPNRWRLSISIPMRSPCRPRREMRRRCLADEKLTPSRSRNGWQVAEVIAKLKDTDSSASDHVS